MGFDHVPGENKFPLRIRCPAQFGGQHTRKRLSRRIRRHGAAARADDAHDRGAILDVVVELSKRRVGIGFLAEVVLNFDLKPASPQIAGKARARLLKLARNRGEKNAKPRQAAHGNFLLVLFEGASMLSFLASNKKLAIALLPSSFTRPSLIC